MKYVLISRSLKVSMNEVTIETRMKVHTHLHGD